MPRAVCAVINYNYGRFLKECLASIDAQVDVEDIRVIVVDDFDGQIERDHFGMGERNQILCEVDLPSCKHGPGTRIQFDHHFSGRGG